MEASVIKSVSTPLQIIGGRSESTTLLVMVWSFWQSSPILASTESFLIRAKDATITQKIPMDLGALSDVPVTGRHKGFRRSISGTGG